MAAGEAPAASARQGRGQPGAAEGASGKRAGGRAVRRAVVAAMVALLLFQMTRQFLPGAVHEATGLLLFAAVVAHNALNRRW